MNSEDTVELVPLLSTKKLSDGCEIAQTGAVVSTALAALEKTFDFSSVYRVHVECKTGAISWKREACDLKSVSAETWINEGTLGIGPINQVIGNKLIAMSMKGTISYSSDGLHWESAEKPIINSTNAPIWRKVRFNDNSGIGVASSPEVSPQYCTNTSEWKNVSGNNSVYLNRVYATAYGGGIFMISVDNEGDGRNFYTSANGNDWDKVYDSSQNEIVYSGSVFGYGGGKWINIGTDVWRSEDNGVSWSVLKDSNFRELASSWTGWQGTCYDGEYFYIVHNSERRVARSKDGEFWELLPDFKVADDDGSYNNITYYKGKLYMVNSSGTYCYVGTFI